MVSTPRESASEPRAGASEGQGLLGVLRDAAAAWQDRARAAHPAGPRNAILLVTLGLIAFGMVVQLGHASTTLPPDAFRAQMTEQVGFRLAGVAILVALMGLGPRRIEPLIPALAVGSFVLLVLCFVPGVERSINGSNRWIKIPGLPSVQPSEIARVVLVLWVARRCALSPTLSLDLRTGFLPSLALGIGAAALIFLEPDLGGTLLFLASFGVTLFVGGARPKHVGAVAACALLAVAIALQVFGHVAERFAVWTGGATNSQVSRAAEAMASGDLFGVGFAQGGFRNDGVQYMQTDYALTQVGEEFGLFGVAVVVLLFGAFVYHALRLVLCLRDRFSGLVVFGLSMTVALQALIHLQVVTGLSPPKGMALPFLSDGGSALLSSSVAVGLVLGAARSSVEELQLS
ncbi:MAG: FtsW/RodA/SpoVE family cell cycle protein [Planctomycetota bacterium]